MANRSDFYTAKLPRYLKKMVALDTSLSNTEARAIRKLFISAHASHLQHKMKRNDGPNVDVGSAAEAE